MPKSNGGTELVLKTGHIDDLRRGKRTTPLYEEIRVLTNRLKENQWVLLNSKLVKYSTWAAAIRRMKAAGQLSDNYRFERHGKDYYLVNRPAFKGDKKPGDVSRPGL
jgi:hypothetical protein